MEAVTYYDDPEKLSSISHGLKKAMEGLDIAKIPEEERLQERGW